MNRFHRHDRLFAITLAALAGYVDAIGFLKTGGFFVSFMSGNSTQLAVGAVRGTTGISIAAGLILSFVIGVGLGTLASGKDGARSRTVLIVVAALLACAIGADHLVHGVMAIFLAAAGMGAENAIFVLEGDVQLGLTYMTGTLVKLGQRLTRALQGEQGTGWFSFFLLWFGLVCGGAAGALFYDRFGFNALSVAVFCALSLSLYRLNFRRPS